MDLTTKIEQLSATINPREKIIIAYSGGVDSALLAYILRQRIGNNMLAVTFAGPLFSAKEMNAATKFAKEHKIPHACIKCNDLNDKYIRNNHCRRCYYCKSYHFRKLLAFAEQNGFTAVWEGSNADDLDEYRPGLQALSELPVVSPYLQFDIGKKEIREIAMAYKLSVADKAATPCLATRFPYGEKLTIEKLHRVDHAEELLIPHLGHPLRVRSKDDLATIACNIENWNNLKNETKMSLIEKMKELGFTEVTIDKDGYIKGAYDKK